VTSSLRSSSEALRATASENVGVGAAARSLGGGTRRSSETKWRRFGGLTRISWALIDQCIVSAANFLTIYLFARHLETALFGAFILAYTGLQLVTSMQNALLIQPHNVLGAGLPLAEYRKFTGALIWMQAISCAVICAVFCIISVMVARVHSPAAGNVILALGIAVVPSMGREFARRVLYTRGEARPATFNDGVSYGLQVLGAFALARFWADRTTPEAALFVLGASSLAGVLVGAWQLRGHACFTQAGVRSVMRTWREVWDFGKWLTGQNALLWFGGQGHSWLIGLMLGTEQVGLYRAATHLANIMNPLRQAAYSYLPSRASLTYQKNGIGGLLRWVKRISWTLLLMLLPFFILLVGFPGPVLSLAYGQRYAGADLALILALSTIAQCITFSKFPFDIGLLAQRATRTIFYIHLLPVILLFTAGIGFIHFMGILGVPLSAILINVALLAATWVAYARHSRRNKTIQKLESQ